MTKKAKPNPNARTLQASGNSEDHKAQLAKIATDPVVTNACAAEQFAIVPADDLDFTAHVNTLRSKAAAVHGGDTKQAETMLLAQAHTLDAIFTQLAMRAGRNMGQYIGAADTYMRLALRSQSQCRATLETLATIKNPSVVFAKQANIAHGHQQVNNGEPVAVARGNTDSRPTELLEHANESQRLDTGAARAAIASDPAMATVEDVYRPAHAAREGGGSP